MRGLDDRRSDWGRERLPLSQKSKIFASSPEKGSLYFLCQVDSLAGQHGVVAVQLGDDLQGGGGTVAAYMANRNIVTVDAGVPVLSMHAPLEIVSKLDCYHTMLACKAIYLA